MVAGCSKEGLDGRSVLRYALGVAAQDTLCVSPRWHATVDALTRTPLVTIEPVIGIPRSPWRVEDRRPPRHPLGRLDLAPPATA